MNTGSSMGTTGTTGFTWPRIASAVLGAWLFVSGFIWPHSSVQMTNALTCGVLAVVFAFSAARSSQLRYLNTALSVWLFEVRSALDALAARLAARK